MSHLFPLQHEPRHHLAHLKIVRHQAYISQARTTPMAKRSPDVLVTIYIPLGHPYLPLGPALKYHKRTFLFPKDLGYLLCHSYHSPLKKTKMPRTGANVYSRVERSSKKLLTLKPCTLRI